MSTAAAAKGPIRPRTRGPIELTLEVTLGLVFVVELLNTAVEAAIDRIGPERHPLSGKAKDAGSAAVTVSLLLHGAVWACVPW